MADLVHDFRFPGETEAYRTARFELLAAERELRRQTEAVAAMRRALPLGGEIPTDYVFADARSGQPVRLSELFGEKNELVLYSFMYGPDAKEACSLCTSIVDGLDSQALHVGDRVAIAVIAKSSPARLAAFAAERGWRNIRLVSSEANSYNSDYRGEDESGSQWPNLNVFLRRDGRIYHTYSTELILTGNDPGQDQRHVDTIWPLWNLFDLTPGGRGTDWYPSLRYDA